MKLFRLIVVSTTVLLALCSLEKGVLVGDLSRPAIGRFGIDTAQMETSVKPGDDFYKYVNGKWLSTFHMPADKARYGIFDALRDKSESDVQTLLNELTKTPPAAGSVQQKVLDFYKSWMDEAASDARSIEPLKADLDAINAANTKSDI